MRHSELADITQAARDQGWTVTPTGNKHTKLVPPDPSKPIVYAPSTPSDKRSPRNVLSNMRASGLRWPPRTKGAPT